MRPVVIDIGCMYRLGSDEAAFKLVSEQGFKYFDYTLFWKGVTEHIGMKEDAKDNARKVKELAKSYGLECRQAHATMLNAEDEEGFNKQIKDIILEIELAAILGAKGIVIHPHPTKDIKENAEMFIKHFVPLADKFNINLLIENTFVWGDELSPTCTSKPNDLKALLALIDHPRVGACVDIGHAGLDVLGTSPSEMIKTLGSKVYALHIHDNDKKSDNHQMLYTGNININEVLDALKYINYQGDITFEILTCYNRGYCPEMSLPLELFPAYIKLEYELGKYIANYLDK